MGEFMYWYIRKLYYQFLFLFRKDFKVYRRGGLKLLLDAQSNVDRSIIRKEYWEKEQMHYLLSTATDILDADVAQNVFIDIGSYLGWYSFNAWKTGAFGSINAFEADPYNFAKLNMNIHLNDAEEQVKVFNVAVSDTSGSINYRRSITDPNNRGRSGVDLDGKLDTSLECVKLDDVLEIKDSIIIVKIDVEGHELNVLNGMLKLLKLNRAFLQVEIFPNVLLEVKDLMEENGYEHVNSIDHDHYFSNDKRVQKIAL